MINNYVRLSIMYDPKRQRWEAWDSAVLPRVIGCGQTEHEALFEMTKKLTKLGAAAPGWINQRIGSNGRYR